MCNINDKGTYPNWHYLKETKEKNPQLFKCFEWHNNKCKLGERYEHQKQQKN